MRPVVSASLGLLVGLALGLALGRTALAPGRGEGPGAEVLEAELEREHAVAQVLRERVEVLEECAVSPGSLGVDGDEPASLESDSDASPIAADEPGSNAAGPGEGGGAETDAPGGFEDERLLALGFHPSDVERLHAAWESLELDRLFLQNERARSTQRDGRYWLRIRELEKATLEELGESDYDALLYAAGSKNRVGVTTVFDESPAEDAGFTEGDQIIAYGERPIYRMHELKAETARCELGTNVAVTVLRDGTERRLWTPCGALGLQLQMLNAPPR